MYHAVILVLGTEAVPALTGEVILGLCSASLLLTRALRYVHHSFNLVLGAINTNLAPVVVVRGLHMAPFVLTRSMRHIHHANFLVLCAIQPSALAREIERWVNGASTRVVAPSVFHINHTIQLVARAEATFLLPGVVAVGLCTTFRNLTEVTIHLHADHSRELVLGAESTLLARVGLRPAGTLRAKRLLAHVVLDIDHAFFLVLPTETPRAQVGEVELGNFCAPIKLAHFIHHVYHARLTVLGAAHGHLVVREAEGWASGTVRHLTHASLAPKTHLSRLLGV